MSAPWIDTFSDEEDGGGGDGAGEGGFGGGFEGFDDDANEFQVICNLICI